MRINDLLLILKGSTSGEQIIKSAAAASGAITLPAGTTDFSATGGASQVVKQTTAGGPFTVGQLAASEVTGALTGNQTITLSGDISGSGATAITTTLPVVNSNVGAFTNANITVNAKGLVTAAANGTAGGGSGTVDTATAGQVALYTDTTTVDGFTMSGDATISATGVLTLAANSVVTGDITNANVTYAKIQNVAAQRVLGNPTGSAAAPSEISLGTGLSFAGTVLNVANGAVGTLTGVTAGTGLTGGGTSGNPTVSLTVPVTVANGGTAATTFPLPTNAPTSVGMIGAVLTGSGTTAVAANATWGRYGTTDLTGYVANATAGTYPFIDMGHALGTPASPALLASGTTIGEIIFTGHTGAGWAMGADIYAATSQAWSGTVQGTTINFGTKLSGSTTYGLRAFIGGGLVVGAPTGGDKGVGTINAVTVSANNTVLTSDARLKRDIEPVPDGCLAMVTAVAPKTFRFRPRAEEPGPPGFYERRNWGFVAQDVRAVLPDAVEEDAEGNLALSPSDLTAVLWQAVKELSAKVEALEARGASGG